MRALFGVLSVALHVAAAGLAALVAITSPAPLPAVPMSPAMALSAVVVTRLPKRTEPHVAPRRFAARTRLRAPAMAPLANPIAPLAPVVPDDLVDAPLAPEVSAFGREALPCVTGCEIGAPDGDRRGMGSPARVRPPVRPGGDIRPPAKLRHVAPAYPDVARAARVEGSVVLECTISPEGRTVDVRVLGGPPLLREAAAEAVQQWVYRPTLLNGVAVPVIMTVTVHFTLSR
jgi:protein TonB